MPHKPYSTDIKERTLALVSAGMEISTAAQVLGVSSRSVQRWISHSQASHNAPQGHSSTLRGRRRLLDTVVLRELREVVRAHPSLFLDELATWLAVVHDQPISVSALHRTLASLGLTHKKLRKTAAQRDELTRTQWIADITSRFTAEQLVFADESSKDHRTTLRNYGRAMAGERATQVLSLKRGVRYSILPALSIDGLLTVRVVHGSVDSFGFYDWIVSDLVCLFPLVHRASVPKLLASDPQNESLPQFKQCPHH